ncbi:MAG: LacI family DNA-binding transcriptional regulator [Oscillospiraceae bacterium]|jgi:LacI family transcriptional regulator|nr:LacI family DNA-binding transcriptional regulator [Oscillospiraceae bacterium]
MTIREIASIAGVSPATISLVLNEKPGVGEQTRSRIKKMLKEYSYAPRQSQAERKSSRRCRIQFIKHRAHGMAVEENQGFVASIIDQIEADCRRYAYDLIMSNCTAETAAEVFASVTENAPDGVILLGTELDPSNYHLLGLISVPLVVLDNSMEYQDIDSVVMANANIAATAVHYLHRLGHRSIAYLQSNVHLPNLKERYLGYVETLRTLDIAPLPPVYLTPTLSGAYADMKRALEEGMYTPQGAVFAGNDTIAIGASRALQEAGFAIPGDISIIGVDDIPFSSVTMPALTTMRISRAVLGHLAVDVVRKRMRHPDWPAMHLQITGQLIERGSVADRR